jgi:hypothetical protein
LSIAIIFNKKRKLGNFVLVEPVLRPEKQGKIPLLPVVKTDQFKIVIVHNGPLPDSFLEYEGQIVLVDGPGNNARTRQNFL